MNVADLAKSKNFLDFNIPASSLYRLAAPSTPAEVVQAVAEGSARGETFTHEQVEKVITVRGSSPADGLA